MAPESPTRPLDDLVELQTEKVIGAKDQNLPYIGLEHMASGFPALLGLAESAASISTNSVFTSGDILFGKLRPNLRKSLPVSFPGYCSTDILVLRARPGVDPGFAARVLQREDVFAEAVRTAEGTKMPRTSWERLKRLHVFAPPEMNEQRRIGVILDTVDRAIREMQAVVAKLKAIRVGFIDTLLNRGIGEDGRIRELERRPTAFQDSPFGRIPLRWHVEVLGSHFDGNPQNGVYKPASAYTSDGVPIVRIDSFYDGMLRDQRLFRRVRLTDAEVNKYALRSGNILINRVNSIEFVGKSVIVPELREPTVFESNMMRIRLQTDRLRPAFAIIALCHPRAQSYFRRRAKSAVAQASVNQIDVRECPLLLPPPLEQDNIARAVATFDSRLRMEEVLLAKILSLKSGFAEDLLTGRVRCQQALHPCLA